MPVRSTNSISHSDELITRDDPDGLRILSAIQQQDDRGPDFQEHKAAFFFKLERELEKVRVSKGLRYMRLNVIWSFKINTFYLQKEAELKLRLETLLSKRRAAATRGLPDTSGETATNHVEWSAVEEGFRLLERDLGKLQVIHYTTLIYEIKPTLFSNSSKSMQQGSGRY